MQDEILVKGTDGKWYILKGEDLVPFDESRITNQKSRVVETPKGVKAEAHVRFEGQEPRAKSQEHLGVLTPVRPTTPYALRPTPSTHEEHPLRVELEEIIDGVMKKCVASGFIPDISGTQGDALQDRENLQKRFRTIVSARLRDVRDAQETREMLVRPVKVGGLGLAISGGSASGAPEAEPRAIDSIIEIIEKAFVEFQRKWKAAEDKKRQEWLARQRDKRDQRQQQEKMGEEQELEERYRRLTGGGLKSQSPTSKQIPKLKIQIKKSIAQSPLSPPALPKPSTPIKSLLAPPPPVVVQPKPPVNLPLAPILSRRERGGVGVEGEPALIAVSQKSQPGKMTDIRQAPKLLGPVEELGSITLKDFRLLGKNPDEAVKKIIESIDRLGKESFTRKLMGVRAWEQSPLFLLYQEISVQAVRESIAPERLLALRAKEGKASMTAEEYYGIMELNQNLRF